MGRRDGVDVDPDVERTASAIASMEIRGAAAIADAAAEALAAQAAASDAETAAALRRELRVAARRLYETRPSAVSLPNALKYVLEAATGDDAERVRENAVAAAETFRERLDRSQEDLGRIGANRLRDGDAVMTHCHSTSVVSCVRAAVEQGKELSAVVKETRPRKQGHVTARQLADLGVDVTLVVDSAARRYLNDVDHVLVGADSVAADGSVVNKVGTSGLAVNARDRGTPVVVAAQTIKLHPATLTGHTVEIEMRDASEVLAPEEREELGDVRVENPAFDVTPPRYVDAIVTERGQFPPESVVVLIRELYGDETSEPWFEEEDG
ncbi:MAG: ribose 1,5-bisphosphate isomerase [Halobacteriaceae archaeon]